MALDVCEQIRENPASAEVIFSGYKKAMEGCARELFEAILDEFKVGEADIGAWSEDRDARSFNISYDANNQGVEVAYSKEDSRIVVSLIFETKGLRSFFIGVSVDHQPTQLTNVGIKWSDAVNRFNQVQELGSDPFNTHKYWLIWKYVAIDDMCDWNGKFFQKMKDDEDFKDRLVRKVRNELCCILVFFKACLEWARGDKTQTLDVYIGRDGQKGGK